MNDEKSSFTTKAWLARTAALRWLNPFAFGVMLAGFAISIGFRAGGWPRCWDDLILSSLASQQTNPNGWPIAVATTTLAGMLLFVSALLFIESFKRLRSMWGVLGAFLYCLGVLAIITWAVSTPLTKGPSRFHANLAYFAYMSSVCGLGICNSVIALMKTPGRLLNTGAVLLLSVMFFFIVYCFFHEDIFGRYQWLLAVTEWVAGILIASSTVTLSFAVVRLTKTGKNDP